MTQFTLRTTFTPKGSQPHAIKQIVDGITKNYSAQTLLGVTGSGKTFSMAHVIEQVQRPTIVIAHNKTLAAQLYSEFKEFFPDNRVEYFVSYYDYYQPESYLPQRDLYIEKDADVNPKLEQMRLAATASLSSRRDVIIVASVSCIYNVGNPSDYQQLGFEIKTGQQLSRNTLLHRLIDIMNETTPNSSLVDSESREIPSILF
jgi:excinuclease ABC subunit B